MCKGEIDYLIKWVGYDDPKSNTWEQIEELDCPEQIREFDDSGKRRIREDTRDSSHMNMQKDELRVCSKVLFKLGIILLWK